MTKDVSMTSASTVVKYAHSDSRTTEWLWYSLSYLKAADCLLEAFSKAEGASTDLLAPLIYNLRHGIELLLKFLCFATGANENLITHDIHKIFQKVDAAFAELDDDSINFASKSLELDHAFLRQALMVMVGEVEALSEKYYSYCFLLEDSQAINDPRNELFRYPASVSDVGPFDLSRCATKVSVPEVRNNIDTLVKFSLFIYGAFGKDENGANFFERTG